MHMVCSGRKKKKREQEHITQEIMTYRIEVPWCKASPQELLSFALRTSEQTQKRRRCHRPDVVQVSTSILEVGQSQIPHSPT